jgi:hypothetical protein
MKLSAPTLTTDSGQTVELSVAEYVQLLSLSVPLDPPPYVTTNPPTIYRALVPTVPEGTPPGELPEAPAP